MIQRIDTSSRLSQALIHNNILYTAGQIGAPGKSVSEQTKAILASIDRLLAEAGSNKTKILQATIWLSDIKDFEEMNAVWDEWVDPDNAPTRATGEVAFLIHR